MDGHNYEGLAEALEKIALTTQKDPELEQLTEMLIKFILKHCREVEVPFHTFIHKIGATCFADHPENKKSGKQDTIEAVVIGYDIKNTLESTISEGFLFPWYIVTIDGKEESVEWFELSRTHEDALEVMIDG